MNAYKVSVVDRILIKEPYSANFAY